MKKIKEVSEMFGISKRTLQYYDDMGILSVQRTEDNHRVYDEMALKRLWKILFYKEIGLELTDIKLLLDADDEERKKIICNHIRLLEIRKEELQDQLFIAEMIREKGIPNVELENEEGNIYIQISNVVDKLKR